MWWLERPIRSGTAGTRAMLELHMSWLELWKWWRLKQQPWDPKELHLWWLELQALWWLQLQP